MRLEYRKYKVGLDVSFANASKQGTIDPADEFTEEQWNALPLGTQIKWLHNAKKKWVGQYVRHWWM